MVTSRERQRIKQKMSPTAPVQEQPGRFGGQLRRRSVRYVVAVIAVAVVGVAGIVALSILAGDDEPAAIEGWVPEYDVDSPAPAFVFTPGPTFWVGGSADLDPDVAWMQPEYVRDGALVAPMTPVVPFFVGSDAGFDPDVAWMQSEYDQDGALVAPMMPVVPFFVGAEAGLDVDVVWMQSEYEADTPAVSYRPLPSVTFWVGQSESDGG